MEKKEEEEDQFQGYKGEAKETLQKYGAKVWSEVKITGKTRIFEGIILPRSELGDDRHIVIKLPNGYDIGINIEDIETIEEKGYEPAAYKLPEKTYPKDEKKPNVTLLGTGGTVAARLDYRTGAVIPAFTPQELFTAVPELTDICNLQTRTIYEIFSENMKPQYWQKIAQETAKEINKGTEGVIIAHGTDTMHYTAAALTFMLKNLPVPVVMVGSQRSSDRPSSDAATNLISATLTAAKSDIAEVTICMHETTNDENCLIHRGTRARKMHSSRRDTFRTIDDTPLAKVNPLTKQITPLRNDYNKRKRKTNKKQKEKEGEVIADTAFEEKTALIYTYPGIKKEIIEHLIDQNYKGIVIAGTGLGHTPETLIPTLEKATQQHNMTIIMTTQCLWGHVKMNVYDTGRKLLKIGIIPGANMLPETAYVKLGHILAHTQNKEEIKKLIQTNI
ncbi:MAG: Glu-tRNA(Gln) amidotransferase subunit GatD, partial [Candidatus Hodarchaeota archaeon]